MAEAARAVVVTGASKGIGRACTLRLARAGWRVYAGVRREDDAASLRAEAGAAVVPVLLDVTDPDQIRALEERVAADRGEAGLQGLVNNAGIAVASPLEILPVDELRRQLEVNVVAPHALIQALLPQIRKARGRIVNIGSIAGRSALPITGAYSMSKFALEAMTDALRLELAQWGIEVVIIEPGVIATPIWETSAARAEAIATRYPPDAEELYGRFLRAARERVREIASRGLPPDAVAAAVEHALTSRRPRTRYLVGRDAKLRAMLQRLPDRVRDRLVLRQMKRL